MALTLLVLKLTKSGFAVGALAACQYGPIFFLSPWAGAIADRVDKRRALLLTQGLEMLQSTGLALLAFLPHPPLPGLYALALKDPDPSTQERHLQSTALTAAIADDLRGLEREILLRRASLIDEAISRGALPVALRYEAAIKIALLDLIDSKTRKASQDKIESISLKLKDEDDASEQLARSLLAVVDAKLRMVQLDSVSREVELPKATLVLARVEAIVAKGNSKSGISDMDLLSASNKLKELQNK